MQPHDGFHGLPRSSVSTYVTTKFAAKISKSILFYNALDFSFLPKMKLEETFAQQLQEQERVFGPVQPLVLPSDLSDLNTDACSQLGLGSTRSSLSSVSEG
nr:unnamed protein product [Callosobruchus analis]